MGLLASPILMSVAARPVLGAAGVNCLSNALSGNLSNPERGLCEQAPFVDWTDASIWPTGNVMRCNGEMGPVVPDSLDGDGETFPSSCVECRKENGKWDKKLCSEGTPFNAVFCTSGEQNSMYRILCEAPNSDEAACVKALLYALTYPDYPLSVMQVQDLCAGQHAAFVSHFDGLKGYLETTWQ